MLRVDSKTFSSRKHNRLHIIPDVNYVLLILKKKHTKILSSLPTKLHFFSQFLLRELQPRGVQCTDTSYAHIQLMDSKFFQ